MLVSLRALAKGIIGHWLQLVGGTSVAVVGFLADSFGFALPTWLWATAALVFIGWAVLLAYHDLRLERDEAIESLGDKMDHQALADALTEKHAFAKQSFFKPGDAMTVREDWLAAVRQWHQEIVQIMQRHNCTPQELHHVKGIDDVDIAIYRGRRHRPMAVLLVEMERIANISTNHAQIAESIAIKERPRTTRS
jgi:hypothetical protein